MSFGWLLRACARSSVPKELSFSSAIISLILSLVASPSNFFLGFAMYKDPNKNLKTPFNLLILNFAAANFVQGSAVLPLSAAFHGLEGVGKMSQSLLKALHLFFFISCTASIISIAVLAIDRCISVSYPLLYRAKSTYSRSIRISIVIWIISVGLSFIYLQVDFIRYTFVFVNCVILLTVIILLFVQFWISRRLKMHRQGWEARPSSLMTNRKTNISARNWNKMVKRDARVTRNFFCILMFFLFLNAPAFIFAYLLNFCRSCDCNTYHSFRDLHFLLVLFPSTVNPFLFGWRLPHFKQALRRIILQRSHNSDEDRSTGQIESSTNSSNKFYRIEPNGCNNTSFVVDNRSGRQLDQRHDSKNNIINQKYENGESEGSLALGEINKGLQIYSENIPESQKVVALSPTSVRRDCLTSIVQTNEISVC